MRDEVKLINFEKKIPIDVSVVRFDTIFNHMHSTVQLLLVLDGSCDIFVDDKEFKAGPNDMIIINPRTFHHLISDKFCTVIAVNIDQKGFGLEEDEINTLWFNLNTMATPNTRRHDQIRYLVYSMIKYNTMENVNSIYTNRAIAFSFFAQLMNDFSVKLPEESMRKNGMDTFNTIGAWLQDHYKENISLSYIAEKFNYSISYLSRLCKAMSGKSYTELYDSIRVNYSLNDLLLTKNTIEEIAEASGFENARSYVRAFNNIYGVNPTEYRKKHRLSAKQKAKIDKKLFKKKTLDKILSQYETYGAPGSSSKEEVRKTSVVTSINFKGDKHKLNFKGSNIIELSGAGDLFNDEAKEALVTAKNETKYNYVLIPHVLSRLTHILTKTEAGHLAINFVYFDKMMVKVAQLNSKPYIIFEYDRSLLKPGEFFALLLQIIEYMKINYYETSKDMMVGLTYARGSSDEDNPVYEKDNFFLFVDCFREFRKNFPTIKLGLPIAFKGDFDNNDDRYFMFLKNCEKFELDYDFIQIRYTEDKKETYLTKNKSLMKEFIDMLISKWPSLDQKIVIQGVNFTNETSLLNDCLYSSSYLLKNYLDNYKHIMGYSKESLVDRKMISAYDPNPFHGESGLFTYNSIKKCSYSAYVFMSKLLPDILKTDKNYIVTASKNKIVILINNYNHYSDLYAEKEYFEIENLSRYTCFPKSTDITFRFEIENLNYTDAKVKISTIGRENGSSYDKWLEMGAIKSLNAEEVKSLKNLSDIYFQGREEIITNNMLDIDVTVAPLEAKLIEIELLNK